MTNYPFTDYNRFIWKASEPDDPLYYSREILGCEKMHALFNQNLHGEHNLFLGAHITLSNPLSTSDLFDRTRETWEALRFELPTLDARVYNVGEDATYMTYRVAKDSEEVKEWSKRTVRLAASGTDLEELRYEVGKIQIPEENGQQTFLYVLPESDISYGFLLYTHHTPFDNAGVQIVMDRFLRKLSQFIAEPSLASTDTLQWGTEYLNLPPPTTEILNEPREGPVKIQAMEQLLTSLTLQPRGFGFGFKKRNIGLGYTRYFHTEFSVDETNRFIQAVRALGGTVNQFAHAAICMVTYQDNPTTDATPEDAAYVSFGLENARRRFLPEHYRYPGHALAFSAVAIPASVVSSTAPRGEKAQLIEVAKVVKEQYKEFVSNPAIMGAMGTASDIIFGRIKTKPPPPPTLCFGFSGDGVAEKYLSHTFEDSDGKTIITLDDYLTSVNMTNPGPFFRVNTWRGRMRLCADANEFAMPPEVVQGFVNKWAQILRLVL